MKIILTCALFIFIQSAAAQTFQEVADISGINHLYGTGSAGGGVSFYDFNGDGWDDITFTSQSGDGISFYENQQGVFTKITSLVANVCESKQILWVDYDNDGDKDLFISCYLDVNRLYNNNGELDFTDVTTLSGLPLTQDKTFGVAWADYDNDGWLDLYITNKPEGSEVTSNQLYRNRGDGTFEETTLIAGVPDEGKKPFNISFLDYNNDGAPDIYIAQDKKAVNTLLKNNSDGTFEDVSVASNSNLSMDGMCVAVGDYDQNGFQDIYISNISDGNRLLKNMGDETFDEVAQITGVAYHGIGWGSNFLDYDNDGDLDLYVSGSLEGSDQVPSIMYTNMGNGTFENIDVGFAGDTVISFSNALGDMNNDGFPDIAVNNFNEYVSMLWKNNGGNNNWLKIQLQGVQSNRDGIGAFITAYYNNNRMLRYTHCGIGFLAQNSAYEIIGLGDYYQVDSLIITWPGGNQDILKNISSNQKIKIIEGATALPPSIDIQGEDNLCPGDSVVLETGFYGSYLWSTGDTTRSIKIFNKAEVNVQVINYQGNSGQSETVSINTYDSLKLNLEITHSVAGTNSGSIKALVSGGQPPYSYDWVGSGSIDADSIGSLAPGTYSVVVKDGNGCVIGGTAEISLLVGIDEDPFYLNARVYPNPAGSHISIDLKDMGARQLEFRMWDLWGKMVKSFQLGAHGSQEVEVDIRDLQPGLYLLEINNELMPYRSKILVKGF